MRMYSVATARRGDRQAHSAADDVDRDQPDGAPDGQEDDSDAGPAEQEHGQEDLSDGHRDEEAAVEPPLAQVFRSDVEVYGGGDRGRSGGDPSRHQRRVVGVPGKRGRTR